MTQTATLLKPTLSKQQELDEMVREYDKKVQELEKELVKFALKHKLDLSLGEYDYGSARYLVVEDGKHPYYEGEPVDKAAGEWWYSNEGY